VQSKVATSLRSKYDEAMTQKSNKQPVEPKRRGEPVVLKVMEVTLEQLAVQGYERLSIPEIATLAGLNKTSIYKRWPTKVELVRDALGSAMGHTNEAPDTGSFRTDFLALTGFAVSFAESPLGMGIMRVLFSESSNPDIRDLATSMLRKQEKMGYVLVFKRAIARGELSKDADIQMALSTVAGAILQRVFVEQSRATDAFLERLVDLVLFGLHRGRNKLTKASS
jgi:AcrR family transcriptional regulator